jgi:hypothetical protein
MSEHWDPWNQGAQQGGRWGPPADDRGTPPAAPGGFTPGGFTPGGFTPGGFTPGGSPTPGGSAPPGFTPDGFAPEGPDGRLGPGQFGAERFTDADLVGAPPKIWLIAALVLGLAAAAVALALGASVGYAFVAWLLAGPVAIGLLAIFTQSDVRQRSMPIYNAPSWLPALYWSAVAAAGLGVLSSAWSIAQWAGHQ